ncbi:MAG TPA: hypothetical protein VJ866_21400 [Pyrinomonadaceae bacterium]|nr:hypothetical protein [Pyrinomonadaceae bacterium]
MRKLLPARLLPSLALVFVLAQAASAQAPAPALPPVDMRHALSALPDAQGVLFVNVRRLVNEVLPKLLPPSQYQKMLTEAKQVGFDARGVEYAAAAVRFTDPAPANGLPEFVVVIRGNFNADTLLSLGRVVAGAQNVKTRSETYGGKTLEIIDLEALNKLKEGADPNAAAADGGEGSKPKPMPYPEVAVVALDASTLVAGVPAYVRAAVDASGGQGGLKASMIDLAAHDPQALWSLTAELPPSTADYLHRAGVPASQEADEMIAWVKQFSFAQGMDALNYTTSASVLTDSPEHASAFSGLIRMGLLAAQTALSREAAKKTGKDAQQARTALAALKTFVNRTEGNTLHLSFAVPQRALNALIRSELMEKTRPAPTTSAKPTRRGRARRR